MLIVGLGAVGVFLYYFMVKALNTDIDAKYRKTRSVQYLCGIFTAVTALAIHLWSATLAWFTAYLGPRIGEEAALAAVTAYQDDTLVALLPMYLPMVLCPAQTGYLMAPILRIAFQEVYNHIEIS